MHYLYPNSPYENENDLCDHNVELCQPCKLCEAEKLEAELEVEEEVEEFEEVLAG